MQATSDPGDQLPAVGLPLACPVCGLVNEPDGVRAQLYVCRCGHHFRMHAGAWIALLAAPGTWRERWTDLRPVDHLRWARPHPYETSLERAYAGGLNESVRAGSCRIGAHRVWLAVFDFRFAGGSLGAVAGERLARAMEAAVSARQPFVLVSASGGARMQEGTLALMQMAKAGAALADLLLAPVPFLSILTDPTYGGTAASLSLMGDVNIAEPDAAIGFTGARVIRDATHEALPAGFQTSGFQLAHGQVDMVVARWRLRGTVVWLLDALTDSPRVSPGHTRAALTVRSGPRCRTERPIRGETT